MGLHSLRILAQAGFSGVIFAAKILRRELPRYWLPLPEFAANVIPCSAPLTHNTFTRCGKQITYEFNFLSLYSAGESCATKPERQLNTLLCGCFSR